MRRGPLLLIASSFVAVALLLAGCSQPTSNQTPSGGATGTAESSGTSGAGKGPIKVGSKIDVEGPVLGNIIIAMLEKNGFSVEDKTRTGATDVVRKALLSGEIDVYPEYTANAILLFHPGAKNNNVLTSATATYETAKAQDAASGVIWLQPAPANNTWGVSIPKKLSDEKKITTFAQWAAYVDSGAPVKVVGSQEFFSSAAAMPAFEKAYGFKLKPDQIIALATGDTSATEKAASQGTNGANAAMAYGTDGTLSAFDLVFLKDDKGVQPYYQPAPTFRKDVYVKYPEVAGILDPVFAKLDLETLQKLNGQVAVEGKDPKTVARDWLTQEGFLK